jgi:hypothetical protein
VTTEELARQLRALPPDEAAALLKDLLDHEQPQAVGKTTWDETVDDLLIKHRSAWERLAKR